MSRKNILLNKPETLRKLREGRDGALDVFKNFNPKSKQYKHASAVCEAIDRLAADLTGEIDYFHTKPHG